MNKISLVECPRDAMQGWKNFIPTNQKLRYLNSLLKIGFHTLDFGSFVSPKAIPQMADTKYVIENLDLGDTTTRLLAIVANTRGAEEALQHDAISYLGFPFSVSPTFQLRNTNSTMEESLVRVEEIQAICSNKNRQLVVYLSMGFGNPYGDEYSPEILHKWTEEMVNRGISIISLADTVGMATAGTVRMALETLIPAYPQATIGVHLHSTATGWQEKLSAAVEAGCTRFDGALKGIGGCPMAQDELVGNMRTEQMMAWMEERNLVSGFNQAALAESLRIAGEIFV